MMKVKSMIEAWEIAHTMIDGLQFDHIRTERGCGKTWSKPNTNETVIDLVTRLEVNAADGQTINIWIEELYKERELNIMKNTNNSSYKIYITSSADAAHLISRGLREATPWTKQGGETISTGSGCVHQDCRIPSLYHGSDKFYALIEYRNGEDWNHPEYQVIIC